MNQTYYSNDLNGICMRLNTLNKTCMYIRNVNIKRELTEDNIPTWKLSWDENMFGNKANVISFKA